MRSNRALFPALLLIISFLAKPSLAGANDPILAILKTEDAVPQSAVKVKQISFTGDDFAKGCSYYELLLRAQQTAAGLDANMMKVVSHVSHSRTHPCDEIEVAFYKDPAPRASEQTFQWSAARPLTWDDFIGPKRQGAGDRIAAETSCGIAIETNLVTTNGKAKVYVFNTFEKGTSWVLPGSTNPEVLQHEQCHWDICELYTRRMQARFDNANITGATLNQQVNRIYDEVTREYTERQEEYEQDTQHGTIPDRQDYWTRMIAQELNLGYAEKL
jgi:hypothetical protein